MVSKDTIKFVEQNRELLEEIVEHGSPAIRNIALAFLLTVPREEQARTRQENRTKHGPQKPKTPQKTTNTPTPNKKARTKNP